MSKVCDLTGEWITLKVSTSAIRTIAKNGMGKVIHDFLSKGRI